MGKHGGGAHRGGGGYYKGNGGPFFIFLALVVIALFIRALMEAKIL